MDGPRHKDPQLLMIPVPAGQAQTESAAQGTSHVKLINLVYWVQVLGAVAGG